MRRMKFEDYTWWIAGLAALLLAASALLDLPERPVPRPATEASSP